MTVADIKEFIDYQITKCTVINDKGNVYYDKIGINNSLEKIKSMLDELEDRPKAKWKHDGSQWENRFICSQCGHKIFEEQQPYCSNCGARMEEEDDTTPTVL